MTLGRRERVGLLVLVPVLCLGLLYKLFLSPSLEDLRGLRRMIDDKSNELVEVEKGIAEHKKLEAEIQELKKSVEARGRAFNLFDFVNSKGSQAKIKDRCKVELRPQRGTSGLDYKPSAVSVTLEGVSLKEMTDFLHLIHAAGKLLTVDSITITVPTRSGGQAGLNVRMTISTLVRA
jgi:Tfp pilus assembly protein PilO